MTRGIDAQKERLLTREEPSSAAGIAEAKVIKDEDLFFLCGPDGSVPLRDGHGLGLYHRDCRYLSGYELEVAGEGSLESLAASDEDGFRSVFQLTNPVAFEGGSIGRRQIGARWRHLVDARHNALCDRYGFDAEATDVFTNLLHAATYLPEGRLPEVFAGYSRRAYGIPVRYPVACHPQAWASGSIPFLVQVLLGLEPDAQQRRMRIVRPVLPSFVDRLELEAVRVGSAEIDLRFERTDAGKLVVDVTRTVGELDVEVEADRCV